MNTKDTIEDILIVIVAAMVAMIFMYFLVGKSIIDNNNKAISQIQTAKEHVLNESINHNTTKELLDSITSNCNAYVTNGYEIVCIRQLKQEFFNST